MSCSKGNAVSEVWAFIAIAIILLICYGIVSSKLKSNRQRKQREKSLPYVEDTVRPSVPYNVYLTDGRKFLGAQLLGTSDSSAGQAVIGGWEGMLILMQSNGKRVFVRQSSVRCIEEA
jgi:hypothetical protein